MTTKQALNLSAEEFSKLSRSELAKVVRTIGATANKRIVAFNKAGMDTPALRDVTRTGGKITTAGKTENQLKAEYSRAKTFLNQITSTKKGYAIYKKNVENLLKQNGLTIPDDNFTRLWQTVDELKETIPETSYEDSERVFKKVAQEIKKGGGRKDVLSRLEKIYDEEYKQRKADNDTGVSDAFEGQYDL